MVRYYVMRKAKTHGWISTRWDYANTKKEARKMAKDWGLKRGQYKIMKVTGFLP